MKITSNHPICESQLELTLNYVSWATSVMQTQLLQPLFGPGSSVAVPCLDYE